MNLNQMDLVGKQMEKARNYFGELEGREEAVFLSHREANLKI